MRSRELFVATVVCCCLLASWPSLGRAQERDALELPRATAYTDLALFHGTGELHGFVADGTILVTMVGGSVRLTRVVDIEVRGGVARAFLGGLETPLGRFDLNDTTRVANPSVGLGWWIATGETRVRLGLAVGLPVAPKDNGDQKPNYLGTLGAFGMWDLWHWPGSLLSFVVPLRLEHDRGSRLRLGIEAAAAMIMRVNEQHVRPGPILQAAPMMEIGLLEWLWLGARVSGVWLVAHGSDDDAQLAFEPRVRADAGWMWLETAATLNLDAPLGPAFGEHGLWGAHVRLGARF